MSEVENFLDGMRGDAVDSTGVFTVDFQKAREKMAKFQLGHETFYLLKIVQAGVLAAESIKFSSKGRHLVIQMHGWDTDQMTLDQLSQSLCSLFDVAPENAAGCLAVGLNAGLGVSRSKTVSVGLREPERREGRQLILGEQLTWEEVEFPLPWTGAVLVITIEDPRHTLAAAKNTLSERCGFSPIPIVFDGYSLVKTQLPETAEKHLGKYFESNAILGEYRVGAIPTCEDPIPSALVHKTPDQGRPMWIGLGVDVDPVATVGMVRHGVVTEFQRVNLGIPGLTAAVEASDLKTDLTALQVADNEESQLMIEELKETSFQLLEDTIAASEHFSSQRQSTSASAPMSKPAAAISQIGVAAGLILPFFLADGIGEGAVQMFGILCATPLVALTTGFFTGYGKDKNSDLAARRALTLVWIRAVQNRPKGPTRP